MKAEEEKIYVYLRRTNRPYSLNDIIGNLKGEVGKTVAQRALNSLMEQQLVTGKQYGKTWIYFVPQAEEEEEKEEEDWEANWQELTKEVTMLKTQQRQKQAELNTLREALTDQQLDERLLQLELENTTLRSRVALLESGEYPRLEKTQVQAIEAAHKSALKELNKRRKWCKEIISTIAENTGQRPQELMVFLLSQNGTLT